MIVSNVVDTGDFKEHFVDENELNSIKNKMTSDVYVVFNSNQVKSINNLNPTDNEDIRYSLNMHYTNFDDIRMSDRNYSSTYIDDEEFYISDRARFAFMAKKKNKNLIFFNVAYSYNHVFLYNNYDNTREGYEIIAIIDTDDVKVNIHDANRYGNERVQTVIDAINEKLGDDEQIYRGSSELLVYETGNINHDKMVGGSSRGYGRRNNGSAWSNTNKFSLSFDEDFDNLIEDLEFKHYEIRLDSRK